MEKSNSTNQDRPYVIPVVLPISFFSNSVLWDELHCELRQYDTSLTSFVLQFVLFFFFLIAMIINIANQNNSY